MKIAYLILAHAGPAQLARLIDALEHEDAYIFIHLDKKADLNAFAFLQTRERLRFVARRVNVAWGAYSIVQATLNGFREIANARLDIGYVNLLSGADYPLKSSGEIVQFLEERRGRNFMEYRSVHDEWTEAIPRLTQYHFTDFHFPGKHFVQQWVNSLLPKRTMPAHLVPVGRSQWMSLTMPAVLYILEFLDGHAGVRRFFRFTWAPDEAIFQTILYNSAFRASLVNDNLRYIDWSAGQASPKVLTQADLDKLLASDALFARKFDLEKYPEVLDGLDRKIQDQYL